MARFWPIEKSQVYAELARLEALGYVRGQNVIQDRLPDKRVFELTSAGQDRFRSWLARSGHQRERRRNPFLVKLFFGTHLQRHELTALIAEHRAEAEADRASYQQVIDHLVARPEARFGRGTASYGLRRAEATIAWCDECKPNWPPKPRQRASDALTSRASRTGGKPDPRDPSDDGSAALIARGTGCDWVGLALVYVQSDGRRRGRDRRQVRPARRGVGAAGSSGRC